MLMLFDLQAQNQTKSLVFGTSNGDPALNNYNLKIGELNINFATGISARWDNNFNLSSISNEQVTTFSLTPSISMQMYWPISPYAQFSNSVSLGYEYFLKGEDIVENGLVIQDVDEGSRSTFNLDLALSNNSTITLSNSFFVNVTSFSNRNNNSGQAREEPFRRFNNVISVQYAQRLAPQLQTTFGFRFDDTFAKDVTTETSVGSSLDSQKHTFFGEISTQVSESLILSLLGSVTETLYDQEFRNDNMQYQIGPGITYIGGNGKRSYLSIKFDKLDFDPSDSSLAKENQSTMLTFSGSFYLTQRNLTEHSFTIRYIQIPSESTITDNDVSIPVNFEKDAEFEYILDRSLNEKLSLNLTYLISHIEESDNGNQFYRQRIALRLPFQLNRRARIVPRYTRSWTYGSDFTGLNFSQDIFDIAFRLDF
jgi:hypothetical protein